MEKEQVHDFGTTKRISTDHDHSPPQELIQDDPNASLFGDDSDKPGWKSWLKPVIAAGSGSLGSGRDMVMVSREAFKGFIVRSDDWWYSVWSIFILL